MEIKNIERFKFYSSRSVDLLKRAVTGLEKQHRHAKQKEKQLSTSSFSSSGQHGIIKDCAYFSDDEISDNSESSNGDRDKSDDRMNTEKEEKSKNEAQEDDIEEEPLPNSNKRTNKIRKSKKKNSKTMEDYQKQMGTPPAETLITEVQNDTNTAFALTIPTALFPSTSFDDGDDNRDLSHFYQSREGEEENKEHLEPLLSLHYLANDLASSNILVISLHSGRFAAAIFNQGECIKHTTFSRYTVRKGQGGSQSTLDNTKGKANSIGSQLRRAGEVQLRNDVYCTLTDWKNEIDNCSIFFLSLSKMLQKGFWQDVDKIYGNIKGNSKNNQGGDSGGQSRRNWKGFQKSSDQVKSIPLDVGKPCFESCCAIYELMMTCSLLTVDISVGDAAIDTASDELRSPLYPINEDNTLGVENSPDDNSEISKRKEYVGDPLTPLHQAAKDGNIQELVSLLSTCNGNHDDIDSTAGPKLMTPLHYAADSSSSNAKVDHATAAKCIQILLTQGKANPCMKDSHNRTPSYLASNDVVRNAFRLARSELGEEIWDWTEAKVDPALTNDDLKNKREKAAEKKRRQRLRQKERKALEHQKAVDAERRTKEEEKMKEQEENARRVRAGLKPKTANSKGMVVCDFCQKDCNGKRKSQLFSRLEFLYCSSDCMRRHQRELMAAAATARMKGN